MKEIASIANAPTRALNGATPAPATLEQFSSILGNWRGPRAVAGFSGPIAGQIIGHFLATDGNTPAEVMGEDLWVFTQEGPTVVLREKIFTTGLKERDDKDVWLVRQLVALEPGHLYFDNFTIVTTPETFAIVFPKRGSDGAIVAGHTTLDLKRLK